MVAIKETTKKPAVEKPKKLQEVTESQEYLLQFFEYGHLPLHMQDTSKHFHDLAQILVATLPRNPERTMALRRLLEAKDCGVRAKLFK